MKKLALLFFAALTFISCEKNVLDELTESSQVTDITKTKKFTFTCKGDFTSPAQTKASYLSTNQESLTDLWVFDYVNNELKQSIHQSSTDKDFGEPVMYLTYGSHKICFVASKSISPCVDTLNHKITWENVKDTYWSEYSVEVGNTTNGNRAVTLDRVTAKLKITIDDEIPTGTKNVTITPSVWYYGIDYITGNATDGKKEARTVKIPESYIGTTGTNISFMGISPMEQWYAQIDIDANSESETIGHAVIAGAPFKRNRSTDYSGNLFHKSGGISISIYHEWDESYIGRW